MGRFFPATVMLVLGLAFLSGCQYGRGGFSRSSAAPIVPPRGRLFMHFKAPLVLPRSSEVGESANDRPFQYIYVKLPVPYVQGVADLSMGNPSLEKAVRDAGIETLMAADYEYLSVLGYFQTMTIHAYGYGPTKLDDPALLSPLPAESPP